MGNLRFAGSVVIAVLLGVAQRIALGYARVIEANDIGLFVWLHARGWPIPVLGYLNILVGFLADTILSLPAAWAILALRPKRRVLYLTLAVVPWFIYRDAYLHWQLDLDLDLLLALAYAKVLLALPFATWILAHLAGRGPSTELVRNSPEEQLPLRGK